jgi:hypothetical protein
MDVIAAERLEAGPPTAIGPIPPSLAKHFQTIPAPALPEIARLPKPKERDPICSASRSFLVDLNQRLAPDDRFLFSLRSRHAKRGAVFMNVQKLLAVMHKAQEAESATLVVG